MKCILDNTLELCKAIKKKNLCCSFCKNIEKCEWSCHDNPKKCKFFVNEPYDYEKDQEELHDKMYKNLFKEDGGKTYNAATKRKRKQKDSEVEFEIYKEALKKRQAKD